MKFIAIKRGIVSTTLLGLMLFPSLPSKGMAADDKSVLFQMERNFVDIIKKVKPTVVDISTEKEVTRQSQPFGGFDDPFFRQFFGNGPMFQQPPRREKLQTRGAGFIIRKDGYIVTNNHVVKDVDKVTVTLSDGKTKEAKIIGTDEKTDLAVIKIEGDNYPVAELGDSESLEVGQIVFTFGSPFLFSGSVSQGIISGLGRELGLSDYEDLIQTDAAMNPGNSGGPLVNLHGEVIGINKAIATTSGQSAGIGFAIPINLVRSVMGSLIKEGKWNRGYLGINMNPLTEANAKEFNLPNTKGVLVTNVRAKSPAAEAGLQEYDVIVEFNSKPVESIYELQRMVALTKIGDKINLKIIREGKEKLLTVTIGEWPEGTEIADSNTLTKWGLSLQTLTEDLAKQKGIDFRNGGVLVTDVDPSSKLYELGIQKNDVILEVDRKSVKNIKDFSAIVQDKKAGDRILFRLRSSQGAYNIILFNIPENKPGK